MGQTAAKAEWPSPVASTSRSTAGDGTRVELISKRIVLPDDVIEGVLHRGAKMVRAAVAKLFRHGRLSISP